MLFALLAVTAAGAADLPLHGGSQMHLASVDEGIEIVGQVDDFVRTMGPLERQLRLQSDVPVASQDYLEFARQQVLAWTSDEAIRLQQLIEELRPQLARFGPLWPDTIQLVKTTGREESHAPHCRGNAIILPARMMLREPAELGPVLIHELFHILSRQSATRRAALFEIVGFRAVDPITLPAAWHDRRITNPDAPQINCVIRLQHDGQVLEVAPVLLTRQDAYPTASDRSLFNELLFGLMPVAQQGDQWLPAPAAHEGKLWQAHELPDYGAKIGRNTRYIIHPEEILADNFVHLVVGTQDLPDAWIVTKLEELLQLWHDRGE
jgi:hypothetical protein